MKGKLNGFQRSVLHWNDMQPYNAVHVVKISAPLDLFRLSRTINQELEHLGLTGLYLDRPKGSYEYRGGPANIELELVTIDSEVDAILQDWMEKYLNTPFLLQGSVNPFRFFVIPEEEAFYLGLVYFHVVAGAESIILLLKHLVRRYLGREPVFPYPLDRYPKGYGKLTPGNGSLILRKIGRLPSLIKRQRRSSRPPFQDYADPATGLSLFSLSNKELSNVFKTAKSWGITLNDLFMALLLQVLAPLDLKRFQASRRRLMTLGSIVNIRKDLGIDSQKTFGVFLSSFIVGHSLPDGLSLEELAKDICQQTSKIKREKLYLGTQLELWLGRLLVSLQPKDKKAKFYPRTFPLWAGITNMNLIPLWDTAKESPAVEYFRSVSTGPFTPLVWSITTTREKANMGLIYKKTVFTKKEIERIISGLIRHATLVA